MRPFLLARVILVSGIVSWAGCSDDTTCPTCPAPLSATQWVAYDDFDDNVLDTDLWNYIADC